MPDSESQRRHLTRIPFDAEYFLDEVSGEQHTGHIIDLSLKGALIERPLGLDVKQDDHLLLNLVLGDGDLLIQMQTRVAHLHESSLGVVCEHLDLDSMSHLCRFLELNLGSHKLLQRELAEMLKLTAH